MIYVDTGCLLKLYYPEPDSPSVVRLVTGNVIVLTALHELELTNALELKLCRKEARPAQVRATRALIDEDVRAGTLHRPAIAWDDALQGARALAERHTRGIGARSLDILHCALAQLVAAGAFVTTDARQLRLASAIGLNCPEV